MAESKDQNYMPIESSKVVPLNINSALNEKFKQQAIKAQIKNQVIDTLEHRYYVITAKYTGGVFDVVRKADKSFDLSNRTLVEETTNTYKDTYYKVGCINPKASKFLQIGDLVKLKYYGNDKQKPFISGIVRNPSGQVTEEDTDVPPVEPPVFTAGMWLQQKGYWWLPNHNRSAIPRLDIIPTTIDHVDQPMFKMVENLGEVGEEGTVVLFQSPIDYNVSWSVKKNTTVVKSGSSTPTNESGVFEHFTISIDENGQPTGGTYSSIPSGIPEGEYNAFSFKGTDHSGTYTATYHEEVKTKQLFRPNEIDDGVKKSLAFKGLCLFPDGVNHQTVSVLTPHLEVEGENSTSADTVETITFVDEGSESPPNQQVAGRFFVLSGTPSTTPTVENFIPNVDSLLNDFFYTDYFIDAVDDNFAFKIGQQGGRSPNFYYSYKDTATEEINTSYTVGPGQEGFSILVSPKTDQYISELSADIQVASYEITEIISVSINGTPDPLAIFSGDTITTSVEMLETDTVAFHVNGYILFADNLAFTSTENQTDYELDHNVPFPGLLLRVNFFSQDFGDSVDYSSMCYILPGTNIVRLYYPFAVGEEITIRYTITTVNGDYYRTSEIRIYEIGGNFTGQRILKTPVASYTLNPLVEYSNITSTERIVDVDLGKFREGQLFVIPNSLTYTIACPQGVIWRTRALLTEPAPAIAEPKVHYTLTPWPTENISTDWYNTDPNYAPEDIPSPLVKNREHPWYNFSCGGYYGIQGSWNRWGGVVGDTTQKLRLWKLNTKTFVWSNHVNLDLNVLLPSDINTSFPARIHGVGKTDYYNRFTNNPGSETSVVGSATRNLSKIPITKNYEAWIVASSWIVEDFQNDIENPNSGHRSPLALGWRDAGVTINAISPETGEILAQYTIRASKEEADVLPVFVDVTRDLEIQKEFNNSELSKSIDKYHNDNRAYYPDGNPEMELKPPHDGQNTVVASQIWGVVPWDSNLIKRLYVRITSYTEGPARQLNYPGMPAFPSLTYDLNTNFSGTTAVTFSSYGSPQNAANLNTPTQPNITMDEDNNIYFCLYMPYWQRMQDILTPGTTLGSGSAPNTHTTIREIGGESTSPSLTYFIPLNGNLCEGTVTVKVNGANWAGHSYPGFITGILVPYNTEAVIIPGTFTGNYVEGTANPETGYPGVPLYSYLDEYEIELNWTQPIVDDYDEFYTLANNLEYPSFSGFQSTPMPVSGMAINNTSKDWSPNYSSTFKPFLFKLHYDTEAKTLTEKWRKDLSHPINFLSNTYTRNGEELETLVLSNQDTEMLVNFTLACGRYIFVIKDKVMVNPLGVIFSEQQAKKSVLQVFKNLNTEPSIFRVIDLPFTDNSENPAAITHITVGASCNVDSLGRESLFIKMQNGRGISVLFPLDEGEEPDVQAQLMHFTSGQPDFPETGFDTNSLGSAGTSYYWLDQGNNVKKKKVTEEE